MGLKLAKGGKLKLAKDGVNLKSVRLNLSWGAKVFDSQQDFDLDITVFGLQADTTGQYPFGKGREEWVAAYMQTNILRGAIMHSGDERTGKAVGVDEYIDINLAALPSEITAIHAVVTIHEAVARGQNFGQVRESVCQLVDTSNGMASSEELATADLTNTPALADCTAALFVTLEKQADGGWQFSNVGEGFKKGLGDFGPIYGVDFE